ncbi:MAG: hypothetical protein E5X74_31470 [Mesorhizobium sp.]|uniref:hypothetical protein n=1 Tax=Mesorhizobium sp. TaxID=1871066 RepID=UPI00120A2A1F|nr:hypothetical protein [Mesorhizobium sp.]TIO80819.1 MAG: hypothetical protein E5X74_31470 [Mesorhizobium sp.]
MSDTTENMVLRTVYLPKDLDQKLKVVAFGQERSKNDIIRELIQAGLKARGISLVEKPARSKPAAVLASKAVQLKSGSSIQKAKPAASGSKTKRSTKRTANAA